MLENVENISGHLTLKLRKTAKTIIHCSSLNCNLLSCEQKPEVLAAGEAKERQDENENIAD